MGRFPSDRTERNPRERPPCYYPRRRGSSASLSDATTSGTARSPTGSSTHLQPRPAAAPPLKSATGALSPASASASQRCARRTSLLFSCGCCFLSSSPATQQQRRACARGSACMNFNVLDISHNAGIPGMLSFFACLRRQKPWRARGFCTHSRPRLGETSDVASREKKRKERF